MFSVMFSQDEYFVYILLSIHILLVADKVHIAVVGDASYTVIDIGIDTNIEAIVVSLTTWEAHHSPRAKPEGCGELPRSLMRQQ